ncbi:2OG-Fe(II) oxygenase [Silanimonas lenta]|mgnify:CR=1 FL=1|uniref:2OG-Fe(II) oxygenase n=1 Tax=Silanimonas lenta TaxID=265429 RepID=UPI002FE3B5C1
MSEISEGRIAEGEQRLEQLAAAGSAHALLQWARLHLYGLAPQPDTVRALKHLDTAAETGLGEARYMRALATATRSWQGGWWADLLSAAHAADLPLAWRSLGLLFGRLPRNDAQAFAQYALLRAARRGDGLSGALAQARTARRGTDTSPEMPTVDPGTFTRLPEGLGNRHWQLAEGMLSEDECLAIRLLAAGQLTPSQAIDPASGAGLRLPIRTSDDATLDPLIEDLALVLLRTRLCALADTPPENAEPLAVLRYRPGQEYRLHRDTLPPSLLADPEQGRGGQRVATVVAYLNAVTEGGETAFPRRGLRITPVPGAALAFRNLTGDGSIDEDSLHAGLPVLRGEKWIATFWLRQRPLRAF